MYLQCLNASYEDLPAKIKCIINLHDVESTILFSQFYRPQVNLYRLRSIITRCAIEKL